jgi:hypothetical protein
VVPAVSQDDPTNVPKHVRYFWHKVTSRKPTTNIRFEGATEGKKRSNLRPKIVECLFEQMEHLIEGGRKIVGKVQPDHWPSQMNQGIVFAKSEDLVQLAKGVIRTWSGLVAYDVDRKDDGGP